MQEMAAPPVLGQHTDAVLQEARRRPAPARALPSKPPTPAAPSPAHPPRIGPSPRRDGRPDRGPEVTNRRGPRHKNQKRTTRTWYAQTGEGEGAGWRGAQSGAMTRTDWRRRGAGPRLRPGSDRCAAGRRRRVTAVEAPPPPADLDLATGRMADRPGDAAAGPRRLGRARKRGARRRLGAPWSGRIAASRARTPPCPPRSFPSHAPKQHWAVFECYSRCSSA